jgi:hypothetical protein
LACWPCFWITPSSVTSLLRALSWLIFGTSRFSTWPVTRLWFMEPTFAGSWSLHRLRTASATHLTNVPVQPFQPFSQFVLALVPVLPFTRNFGLVLSSIPRTGSVKLRISTKQQFTFRIIGLWMLLLAFEIECRNERKRRRKNAQYDRQSHVRLAGCAGERKRSRRNRKDLQGHANSFQRAHHYSIS